MNQEEFVMCALAVGPLFAQERGFSSAWLSRTLRKAFAVDVNKIPQGAPDPVYHFLLSEANLATRPYYIHSKGS